MLTVSTKTKDDLKTGDIILCHSSGPDGSRDKGLDGIIEYFTHSPWEHAGIIIKDPWWTDLKGLYIYQSGWGPNSYKDVLNGNVKGVTLNHLDDFLRNREYIFVRSLENFTFTPKTQKLFVNAFNKSHGKPYDSNCCSWCTTGIGSFCRCECFSRIWTPPTEKTFWCSALVAFMYVEMGWFEKDVDWSCQTPADLADALPDEPFHLSKIWELK